MAKRCLSFVFLMKSSHLENKKKKKKHTHTQLYNCMKSSKCIWESQDTAHQNSCVDCDGWKKIHSLKTFNIEDKRNDE